MSKKLPPLSPENDDVADFFVGMLMSPLKGSGFGGAGFWLADVLVLKLKELKLSFKPLMDP